MEKILERLINLISEEYDKDASALSAETKFEDLSFDSLDISEMVMTLEDEFDINIEMNESLNTIGALAEYINEKLA